MSVVFDNYQEGDIYELGIREGDDLGVVLQDHPFPAWTMRIDGEVAACGGVVNAGGGVGNGWVFVSEKARGHGKALTRFVRGALDRLFDVMRYHRIQTVIRVDRPEYERWATLFGFEKECVLRKASPAQEDLFLFARVT